MNEISLENLNALVEKARELQQILTETPEVVMFLKLTRELDNGKIVLPRVDDVLVRSGKAAEILGVNQGAISRYVKTGLLRGYYVAGSSHMRFWRSEVKALAKPSTSPLKEKI